MTDARFPERWLNDRRILRLSPEAFRAFVMSLVWAVGNRTDGRLDKQDLELVPGDGVPERVPELVESGLWQKQATGQWRIVPWRATQTSRNQLDALEHKRALDRERSRRYRARKGEKASRDKSRDDKGQDRTGQDRT